MQSDGFEDLTRIMEPAIYALFYKGKIMYIGQSKRPMERLTSHKTRSKAMITPFGNRMMDRFPFDQIFIRSCKADELDRLEIEMIQKHKPKYNIKLNSHEAKATFEEVLNTLIVPVKIEIERRI